MRGRNCYAEETVWDWTAGDEVDGSRLLRLRGRVVDSSSSSPVPTVGQQQKRALQHHQPRHPESVLRQQPASASQHLASVSRHAEAHADQKPALCKRTATGAPNAQMAPPEVAPESHDCVVDDSLQRIPARLGRPSTCQN